MKKLLVLISVVIGSPISMAQEYSVICEAGRWEGNSLDTSAVDMKMEVTANGTGTETTIFEFSLPAKSGDEAQITFGSKKYSALITYAHENYILLSYRPIEVEERYAIQIPSGWVHYSYNKYFDFREMLTTQTFGKKCELYRKEG